MKRPVVLGLAAIVVIVVGIFVFPLIRPIFVDDVVDEGLPGVSEEDIIAATQRAEGTPMPDDDPMEEPMPDEEPTALVAGTFTEIDFAHSGEGTATVYELPTGENVVRFEEFRVTNGPDLHVLLAKHPDPRTRADLGEEYIDLGQLKGNVGSQNYTIPADVDLSEYNSVVIYCMPFHVVFSTAPLAAAEGA
jgi:hypothetical protein